MLMRDELKAAIEAVLFASGEKISVDELAVLLGINELDLKAIMQEMILDYNQEKRGIQIVPFDNGYIMCTRPAYSGIVSKLVKIPGRRLSAAAMETLAIIAYQQPVTRAEIEQIRGVKVDKIINNLLEKGLIKEDGQKEVLGKPILYVTTHEFLKTFALSSLKDLPNINELEI